MTSTQIVPVLIVPLVVWRVYSRIRRNIGRQRLRRGRLVAGVVLFSVITVLIGLASFRFLPSLEALGGGILLGVPLALISLRLTRFESSSDGEFYTPNTAIGLSVAVLLIARIVYRMVAIFGPAQLDRVAPPPFQSPLTLLIFGATAGYYITYYSGLLIRLGKSSGNSTGPRS